MKKTRDKTSPERSRKIRGTCDSPRDPASKHHLADFRQAVWSRKIRGTCDSPRLPAARRRQDDLWTDTKSETGFTIAELLIALAISAMLLAAVAVAIHASVINYEQNEDIFKTINSARQALFRITTQLRTADAADPNAPSNQCTFITAGGENLTYDYRNADQKLYLITNSDGQEYLLCDNVTAMTFTKNVVTEDSLVKVKSVQINMTVARGDVVKSVSSAAVIRRNLN